MRIKDNIEQGKNTISAWNIVHVKMSIDSLVPCLGS